MPDSPEQGAVLICRIKMGSTLEVIQFGGGGMECRPVIILCTSGQGLAEVWVGLVKIRD